MKRIVCDTNVLISGLLWNGPPRRLLEKIETNDIKLFISHELLEDLARVLSYPKIAAVLDRADLTPHQILRWTVRNATMVLTKPIGETIVADDPSDDRVLACALAADADAVVSGDKHLKQLGNYKGIPILTAAGFLQAKV